MRTDRAAALLLAALLPATLLCARPARALDADRFGAGLSPEVTLVGLSFGARPELSFRPFAPGTASRLRFAPGYLVGPEFQYVPVALGYRALWRSHALLRPMAGLGLEYQRRWVSDAPAAQALGAYVEGGLLFGFGDYSVGAAVAIDALFAGEPGAGLSARLVSGWRL